MYFTLPPATNNQSNLGVNLTLSFNNQSLALINQYKLSTDIIGTMDRCFLPAFCSGSPYSRCFNTTLATCDQCSYAGFLTFGVALGILGLAIVVMNLFVLLQISRKKNQGYYDKIKASLAVADILAGFQPLVISLNNLHWTVNSTANEFIENIIKFSGLPQAIVGGIFYLLGISSSLYHLVFLSQQRVFAMRWPLKYKVQSAQTFYICLGIVWFLAIFSSVAPAWFPNEIKFVFNSKTFSFTFIASRAIIVTMTTIAYALPFLMMTCFMIYSVIVIRRNASNSKKLAGRNVNHEALNKREMSMLKTVALMQVGFTITLLPLAIVTLKRMLYPATLSTCRNDSIPRLVCSYLSMTNSLVNPLIYSIRDRRIRQSIVRRLTSKVRVIFPEHN